MTQNWSHRNTVIVLLLVGVACLVSFSYIRSVKSETNVDYVGSGYRFGEPEVNLRGAMYLYVEGGDHFSGELESCLSEKLDSFCAGVVLCDELQESYDSQALAVRVTEKNIHYDPFTPSAEVEVKFVYFSNGNTIHYHNITNDKSITISGGSGVIQEGKINIMDKSRGFASYPSYLNLLAYNAVENIFQYLPED